MKKTTLLSKLLFLFGGILGAIALFAGCGGPAEPMRGIIETPKGKGPKVIFNLEAKPLPEIPLPIDLATRLDPTSSTGRRINVYVKAKTLLEALVRKKVNRLDGFGVYSPITVQFDAPLDIPNLIRRHQKNLRFQDDAVFVICLNPNSPNYGKPVLLDMGRGNFPLALKKRSNYFDYDPHAGEHNILFETRLEEDKNGNGKLDPEEDLDFDGTWDKPNVYPPGAQPEDALIDFFEFETNTLILRPVFPLEPESTYAVVLTTRLIGKNGHPVRSPFPYVNHSAQTKALEPLFRDKILERLGISQKEIAFMWTFTTQRTYQTLKEIRDGLYGYGPFKALAGKYPPDVKKIHQVVDKSDKPWLLPTKKVIEFLKLALPLLLSGRTLKDLQKTVESFYYIDYFVSGEITGPDFLIPRPFKDGDIPLEGKKLPMERPKTVVASRTAFELDPHSGKMVVGDGRITWWCSVPRSHSNFKPPFPVVFYSHGYTSSRFEMLAFAGTMAKFGLATCGIDAYGHGFSLGPRLSKAAEKILAAVNLKAMWKALSPGRARDLNNDGVPDSGGDFWTADTFHTRDIVRQTVIDYMQVIRVMRSWNGKKRWTLDIDGDKKADLSGIAGDFNGDGIVDMGGPTADYYVWGQSLGGILSSILAGIEPAITAAAPVAGGGGLIQLALRSKQGGVVEAVFLRLLGPLVIAYGDADDRLELRFWVPDVNSKACSLKPDVFKKNPYKNCLEFSYKQRVTGIRFARTKNPVQEGDKVVLKNLRSGEENWALIKRDPRNNRLYFRVPIASDALNALEKRELLNIPTDPKILRDPNYVPPIISPGPDKYTLTAKLPRGKGEKKVKLLGDPLEITIYRGTTSKVREKITTTNEDYFFQGVYYKRGIPLFAPFEGMGLKRQHPRFRRFMTFASMIVEPADPIVFAPLYHLRPVFYHYERNIQLGANVLVIPTLGDMNVPVDTGIAIARAAGIIPVFSPDPRYPNPLRPGSFLTPNQVLIHNFVVEGVAELKRFTHPVTGRGILFDPDDLSNNSDGFGSPRLHPPLRLTVRTPQGGVAAMRIPNLNPNGQHGFSLPDPRLKFDYNLFMANQIGVYFRSRGTEVRDDPCLEKDNCPDIPPPPPLK